MIMRPELCYSGYVEKVVPSPAIAGFFVMRKTDHLSTQDVSAYLGVSVETIKKWRQRNNGPPFHHEGLSVFYVFSEVNHWNDVCCDSFMTGYEIGLPRTYGERLAEGFAMMDDDFDGGFDN